MSKKTKVTDFKTNRINKLTGGRIMDYQIPDYPGDDGKLPNSFMSSSGDYISDYAHGWWYVKNNMVVCNDYPHGVAIVLNSYKPKIKFKNSIKDEFESWFCEQWENDNLKGYYGYSHRGGQTFKIGDRLFNETYEPKEEDYTKGEWTDFLIKRIQCIKRNMKEHGETEEQAIDNVPISDVIPFRMRGTKLIENWNEAKQAAINMSQYLS